MDEQADRIAIAGVEPKIVRFAIPEAPEHA
jgi:hypothetical protein